MTRKDQSLDLLASRANVAQFVGFAPTPAGYRSTYSRLRGLTPNTSFPTLEDSIRTLLERGGRGTINVRTYSPESPQSRPFYYGLSSIPEVSGVLSRSIDQGLYAIINETVDVSDGGVSGVVTDHLIEFAPDDTPRAVERPGVASLPFQMGLEILTTVYGFNPALDGFAGHRLEFSLHPAPQGWKQTHTLAWELSEAPEGITTAWPSWPNTFSRLIGDKVFGLLVADQIGLCVPRTTVINRRVSPFSFGQPTGSGQRWTRTAPAEQDAGRYSTAPHWLDPFDLLAREDPSHRNIPSVLAQDAVPAEYSGASVVLADGSLLVEGVPGSGQDFMLGQTAPSYLPERIRAEVVGIHGLAATLGPIRFEWVYDGRHVWIVQLHRGATRSSSTWIVPGHVSQWVTFEVKRGLEAMKEAIATLPRSTGLILSEPVGLTSHIADVVRKANIPTRVSSS